MAALNKVFGNKSCLLLSRRFPSLLHDSVACLSIYSTKLIHQQNKLLPRIHSVSCSPFSSRLFNHQNNCASNKTTAISSPSFSTSSSESNSDDKGIQVYEGRAKGLLKRVKIFSLSTSIIGLVGQPYLWYTVQDMSLFLAAPLFTVVNFFVFANPLMIHYLAKRYVTELYYNPANETYTATVLSFFAMKQSVSFTAKDVVVPEIPGLFSMLTVKGRPIFIDHRDFTSVEVYKQMMGFDKPLDLTYVAKSNEKSE